jgi:hypothetical protein
MNQTPKQQDQHSLEYLAKVATKLFKRLGIDNPYFDLTPDTLDFHGIWASKCEIELKRIGGSTKVPGFAVGVTVHVSQHPYAPDDADVVETGQYVSAFHAAIALAELYYKQKIEREAEIVGIDLDREEGLY